jgi:hypothetical protein
MRQLVERLAFRIQEAAGRIEGADIGVGRVDRVQFGSHHHDRALLAACACAAARFAPLVGRHALQVALALPPVSRSPPAPAVGAAIAMVAAVELGAQVAVRQTAAGGIDRDRPGIGFAFKQVFLDEVHQEVSGQQQGQGQQQS